MAIRWNGRDLQEDLALEQGLFRRIRTKKSRSDEILGYFELMKRVRKIAKKLSKRDDVLIDAVLRCGNLSGAARDLSPDRADILRCYLSQRLGKFRKLARLLLIQFDPPAPPSKDLQAAD